jgi:hypothetical protein
LKATICFSRKKKKKKNSRVQLSQGLPLHIRFVLRQNEQANPARFSPICILSCSRDWALGGEETGSVGMNGSWFVVATTALVSAIDPVTGISSSVGVL